MHHGRRDEDGQVLPIQFLGVLTEQQAQAGDVTEERNLDVLGPIFVLDQSAHDQSVTTRDQNRRIQLPGQEGETNL